MSVNCAITQSGKMAAPPAPVGANAIGDSVVAGTASELAGEKFANSAMSGAFAYLFNELGSKNSRLTAEYGLPPEAFGGIPYRQVWEADINYLMIPQIYWCRECAPK